MNERIKLLANQSWEYARKRQNSPDEDNEDSYYRNFQEKFAELIIRECAEIAKKEQAFNARYSDADKHPQVNIDQCILIEFGL